MTLFEYDQHVKPHLHFIEAGCEMAARHAGLLPARPDFESLAEIELAEVRKVLHNALEQIITAQAMYQSKKADA